MYSTSVLHMLNTFLTYVKHVFNKRYDFALILYIYIYFTPPLYGLDIADTHCRKILSIL